MSEPLPLLENTWPLIQGGKYAHTPAASMIKAMKRFSEVATSHLFHVIITVRGC